MELRGPLICIFIIVCLTMQSFGTNCDQTDTCCYIAPNISAIPLICPNTSNPCITLSQFASSLTTYIIDSSQIDLVLLPGYHSLQTQLKLENYYDLRFRMFGTQSSISVTISGQGSASLEFRQVSQVRISHITFDGFSTFKSRSVLYDLFIYNCSFINGNETALEAVHNGDVILVNSNFISNVGSLRKVAETGHTNTNYSAGGALYLLGNEDVWIEGCAFINNSAEVGGVIYAKSLYYVGDGSNTFTIRHCSFLYNKLEQSSYDDSTPYNDGVILHCEYASRCMVTITMSVFKRNRNSQGLALFAVRKSTINIKDSHFIENYCAIVNAEACSDVNLLKNSFILNVNTNTFRCGGLFLISYSSLNINKCNFMENSLFTSHMGGGTVVCTGFGIIITTFSNFTCNYVNSTGGVFYLDNQSVLITNHSWYNSNTASLNGGVLALRSSSVETYNNTFVNNTAFESGGVFSCIGTESILSLHNNSFNHNHAKVSGGVIFISESSLFISNSVFQYNFAPIGGVIEASSSNVSIDSCNFTENNAEQTGGVGALYSVGCTIVQSVFYANKASDGGAFFMKGVWRGSFMTKSTFVSNEAKDFGAAIYGGSSSLSLYMIHFTKNSALLGVIYFQTCHPIHVEDTVFSFNNGSLFTFNSKMTIVGDTKFLYSSNVRPSSHAKYQEGGAITCVQSELTFNGGLTLFNENTAKQGGAVMLSETKLFNIFSTIKISSNHATFSGGGMYLFQSEIIIKGDIILNGNTAVNKGGAVHMIGTRVNTPFSSQTLLEPPGTLHVIGNMAEEGGGIYFEGNSKLYISKEGSSSPDVNKRKKHQFSKNSASRGGAIYIADGTDSRTCSSMSSSSVQSTATECTLQVLALFDFIVGYSLPQNFFFSENTAYISGSDLYGGLLDRCKASFYAEMRQAYNISEENFLGVSYLKKISNISVDKISSDPVKVCFCINGTQNCSLANYVVTAVKGEKRTLELVAVDQIERPVNATIRSYLSSGWSGLGEGQLTQYVTDGCSEIELEVSSLNDSEVVTLYAEGPCKDIGLSKKTVQISFQQCMCPIGFKQNEVMNTRCVCICDDVISSLQATCDPVSHSIIRRANFWLTYVYEQDGYLVYTECPFDYCRPATESVSINLNVPHGADAQCENNRMGQLCGACQPGYSAILGSTKCLSCSTGWIALTFVFGLLGMALVAFILYLNLTVAVGTTNGLTLYANTVMANREIYIPKTNFLSVFISWLNLDLGIESCLYNGMDSYAKLWLRFLFPLYVIVLVILIIVLSERWGKFAKLLTYKNPVATLSTLILLSYTQLLRTIISSFSFAILEYPDGSRKASWLLDANIDYFGAKHAILLLAAILIVIVGLVYTIFLFSWQWILKLNERAFLNWIRNTKLNLFMDTYHAPYNFKYRYWTGLLLFVRIALYLVASTIQNMFADARINLVFTTLLITGICVLRGYLRISSLYKNWLVDILELTFYFNIIIFSAATLYVHGSGRGDQNTIATLSVGITFLIFVSVVLYHIYAYCLVKHTTMWTGIIMRIRRCIGNGLLHRQLNNTVTIDHTELEEHLIDTQAEPKPTSTIIERFE